MQDFSQRIIIIVRRDIEPWQIANTIGHIAAYLGNKMKVSFDTGDYFVTKDEINHPRNSQYPIIIKSTQSNEQLRNLFIKVRETNFLHHAFIKEMIDHTNDMDLQNALTNKYHHEIEYLGVGIFGPNEEVNQLTKKFSLHK